MNFWPFPVFLSGGRKSQALTKLFLRMAADPTLKIVEERPTSLSVTGDTFGRTQFWNANKYYAWASDGTYTSPTGTIVTWKDEMPSRWAIRQMRLAIERLRFPFELP